jgi:serine/threonine-protein kinase
LSELLNALREALADRYALERELGRGGMATVFLAEDLKHRRKVAIKVLHAEIAAAIGPDRSCARSRSPLDSSIRISCRYHDSGAAGAISSTSCPSLRASHCRIG